MALGDGSNETDLPALNRRLAELAAENDRLRDFTVTAFHDLQEPLRKIGAFTDLLEQALATDDADDAAYALDVLRRSARQVQQLVKDVLAYSRSARGEVHREPVELKRIVDEVLSAVSGTVVETSAILSVSIEPATVRADRLQLYHLVLNLVSNSLKFFTPGTEPYVEIRSRRADDGGVVLTVRDRGIGFEQTAGSAIFEPFRRLNPRSAYTGSGLGLSICKAIVERHGWRMAVESAPGAGAAFEIRFPPEAAPAGG
ncbi:sensor histidine kinase [Oharaeibacter diazotrophicus]|uniref:histidine kinase n=1 Tax=Oharaeibacter diazotrophicus TaxID=1920512 RepID=A0A4R6RJK0_9HYPH|nr:ATP-binding protein [Oharaeibacter diazotrophicus]TDP86285.1 phospho-acceptor domain-containing protein [Oharaeibacter diazotrophicus]BBE71773.1 phytochrome-like protein cph1 [Pleomorphomonas sp. SM30]GLS78539.1 hypothetical protein GCM10007904_38760 [Oharaeibacter diazotrophicus]